MCLCFKKILILASPYVRHDKLEEAIRVKLPKYEVIRIRSKTELTLSNLQSWQPNYIFFLHWSWLIPKSVYDCYDCVVFHMTDLPYGRGGSPLQNLIIRGHTETKLTAFQCVKEIDAGPIYLKCALSLHGTAEEIMSRCSSLMEEMILEIIQTHIVPVPQTGEVTLFSRRKPDESNLISLSDIKTVYDYIRMLDDDAYPKAFIESDCFHFEFSKAILHDESIEARVVIRRKDNTC
jgi:methionyl-tRNA formyltransferase